MTPTFAACLAVGSFACRDWDVFDPRLGQGGDPTSSTTGGSPPIGGGGSTPEDGGGGEGVGGTPGLGGAGGAGGTGPLTVEYVATVADCVDPNMPDPDACEAQIGDGVMTVDLDVSMTGPRQSYLRFDTDKTFVGTVDAIALILRVPKNVDSESGQTGQLWQVDAFTRDDLFMSIPAPAGNAPLVGDIGPVAQGEDVAFDLPTDFVLPGESAYFGLLPIDTDGVDYFNANGAVPPRLVITYH